MKRVTSGLGQGLDAAAVEMPTEADAPLRAEDFQPDWFPDDEEESSGEHPESTTAADPDTAVSADYNGDDVRREHEAALSTATPGRTHHDEGPWQPPQWRYSTKRARLNQRQQQKTP